MNVYSASEWRRQSQLLDERDRLRDLLEDLWVAATNRDDSEPHDVTGAEAALQADGVEAHLAVIDTALDRIESGEYGRCRACGSAIPEARLDALLATTLCRECVG